MPWRWRNPGNRGKKRQCVQSASESMFPGGRMKGQYRGQKPIQFDASPSRLGQKSATDRSKIGSMGIFGSKSAMLTLYGHSFVPLGAMPKSARTWADGLNICKTSKRRFRSQNTHGTYFAPYVTNFCARRREEASPWTRCWPPFRLFVSPPGIHDLSSCIFGTGVISKAVPTPQHRNSHEGARASAASVTL